MLLKCGHPQEGGEEEMERTQYIPVGMGWEL
jgi:hypothetical protein